MKNNGIKTFRYDSSHILIVNQANLHLMRLIPIHGMFFLPDEYDIEEFIQTNAPLEKKYDYATQGDEETMFSLRELLYEVEVALCCFSLYRKLNHNSTDMQERILSNIYYDRMCLSITNIITPDDKNSVYYKNIEAKLNWDLNTEFDEDCARKLIEYRNRHLCQKNIKDILSRKTIDERVVFPSITDAVSKLFTMLQEVTKRLSTEHKDNNLQHAVLFVKYFELAFADHITVTRRNLTECFTSILPSQAS